MSFNYGLPRLKDRGPIEAATESSTQAVQVIDLPRLKDRGPIEANARSVSACQSGLAFLG